MIRSVYVSGTDAEALARFYQDALDLEPSFADTGKWHQFKAGGSSFAVASPGESATGAPGTVIVFNSSDLEAARARIAAAGGAFIAGRDMGDHGRTMTFRDPEGNVFQLFSK